MIRKKQLFHHSLIFILAFFGIALVLQSCEKKKQESTCKQNKIESFPVWSQDAVKIHAGTYVRYSLWEPLAITDYVIYWEFEGGTPPTHTSYVEEDVVRVKYLQPGSFKVTMTLKPRECPDYDSPSTTRNPSIEVVP